MAGSPLDVKCIQRLVRKRAKHGLLEPSDASLRRARLAPYLVNATGAYLRHCLPRRRSYIVWPVAMHPLARIKGEMHPECSPGGFIAHAGFVVVGSGPGGDAICFHAPSDRVCWADHSTFCEPGLTAKQIEKQIIVISDSLERFVLELLNDVVPKKLVRLA